MTIQVTTHLNFRGQAREALAFYHAVFGGAQTLVTYGDLGAGQAPGQADHVIWGQVVSEDGFRIMAYDVQPEKHWSPGENAFYVSLRATGPEAVTAHWEALRADATILQPLGPSAWSPLYGMLKDRFGVIWIVDVAPEAPRA